MAELSRAQAPSHLLIGEVLRPHSVHGEFHIKLFTDYPERIGQLVEHVYVGSEIGAHDLKAYRVKSIRAIQRGFAILSLHSVDDRDQAERLRKKLVMIAIEDAVPLEQGEFYLYQLIGLQVKTDTGQELGTLTEVLETGANDVYVVESAEYGEILIPAIEDTIIQTDIHSGTLTVRLIEGLIPQVQRSDSESTSQK